MANNVSLIPKSQKEKALPRFRSFSGPKIKLTAWTKLGIGLLVLMIILGAGSFIWQRSLTVEEALLQDEFISIRQERDASLEKEIANTGTLLSSFEQIIKNHRRWTQLLAVVEEKIVVGIVFSSFDGNYETGEFSLKGESSNYNLVARQIKSFEEEDNISQLNVSNIRLNKEGKVEFTVNANFKQSLVKATDL